MNLTQIRPIVKSLKSMRVDFWLGLTNYILGEVLGLSHADLEALAERNIIGQEPV